MKAMNFSDYISESILFFNPYTPITSEEGRLSEAVEKSVADTPFLDDTDDFIQSHVDPHHPPSDEVPWDYVVDHQEDDYDGFIYSDGDGMANNTF